jgi:aryl-alcohol dehydrogenase-like predicted oxidoreductase
MKKVYITHTDLQVRGICMGTANIGSLISQEVSFELLNLEIDYLNFL